MKILVIEDEKELASDIVKYLSEEDYRCETASDFASAKEKVSMYQYDCILLDLMLPGGDGFNILEHLRSQNKQDGVIIISAKDTLQDKIKGLNIGADDFLAKPFHHSELAARIHSVIRRKQFDPSNLIVQNEIKIDLLSKTVHIEGNPIVLTKKEYDLLLFFIGNKNRVLSKSALAEHLSGDLADMFDSHDFVYAHVKNLKKKLSEAGYGNYLKTMYGTGYKWEI
ncbi:response regulator transcription factor [uncultured Algoriphagus sp.]|uniref:response regulator transcription factor n=1 Tax=uncultured Algoriphagus sp. TaxID=417365 RepID=UPI0030ED15D1|tara:strand:- start:1323 stop:1997 length:675 start_codon:yes stop_codon:yes gene_type:complete